MTTLHVNIHTRVNSAGIRTEVHNGREHIVLPSYTLPANVVMNGGLYPETEINAHFNKLEGTLAPLGHPTRDGKFCSAFDAEGINAFHVGAWNRNVKKSGNRVYMEKWIDVETANGTEKGRAMMARIAAIVEGHDVPPIHTSVAAFVEQMPAPEGETSYQWVAKIHGFDHDAILLDEPGAATPEQGVGLLVNADQAAQIKTNGGALIGESYNDKLQRLGEAATRDFVTDPDKDYVWVSDFTDSQVIINRGGGKAEVFGYKMESGKIVFDNQGTPVQRRETWVVKLNRLLGINAPQQTKESPEMAFSTEDKTAIAEIVGNALASALKPIGDSVAALQQGQTALQANHDSLAASLTANQRAADDEMRKVVAAKFGEVVANSLQGQALADMHKQCGEAATLAGNSAAGKPASDGFDSVIK